MVGALGLYADEADLCVLWKVFSGQVLLGTFSWRSILGTFCFLLFGPHLSLTRGLGFFFQRCLLVGMRPTRRMVSGIT